uniref:Uncharacterized protein n=1 Tax=Grammatophora oceanica TaxID=210454 RepID=A0A7S1YBW4_9STRA
MTNPCSSQQERLAAAAEELVRAAVSESDAAALAIGRATVAGLDEMTKGSASLKESLEEKLNTVNENISDLKSDVTSIKESLTTIVELMKNEHRNKRIEFALSNLDLAVGKQFTYEYKIESSITTKQGEPKDLFQSILQAFRKGEGLPLPTFFPGYYRNESEKDAYPEAKRTEVVNILHNLLGVKPRVEVDDDGRHTIYYA